MGVWRRSPPAHSKGRTMDIVLIFALLASFAWMLVCLRKWHYWRTIARLNRQELNDLTLVAHEHVGHSYDRGYMLGLANGAKTMYETAHRAGASDMVLVVLNHKV